MAYENLELIVVFNGSKSTFKPADYPGKLVLVTGGYDSSTFTAKDPYLYAIDDAGNYRVFDVPSSWISGIKALKSGSTTEYISLQGVAEFLGANGISVSIDSTTKKLTVDGLGLLGTTTDDYSANTIYGAKASALKAKNDLLGTQADASNKETIRGTRALVKGTKTELIGDSTNDTAESNTIYGAKKYADGKATTAKTEACAHADAVAATAKSQAVSASTISINSNNTTEGMLKSYTFTQGGVEVGTIDIPKDLVVSSGSVVNGTWTNSTTFTESASGKDVAIKLVLSNNEVLYINAATLVDVYGVDDTTTIDMTITGTTISASIKAGSVGTNELGAGAVTDAKIAASTISKSKLATGVQTSLGKADTSIQSVESTSDYISVNTKTGGTVYQKDVVANTATISDVSSDDTKKGLATAEDVYAFISACLSVKILS